MPGAVVRSIIRHRAHGWPPARLAPPRLGSNRIRGWGDKSTVRSYLPLADTIRGANAPEDYLRSSLSYPLRDVLSGSTPGTSLRGHIARAHDRQRGRSTRSTTSLTASRSIKQSVATEVLGSIPGRRRGRSRRRTSTRHPLASRSPGSVDARERRAPGPSGKRHPLADSGCSQARGRRTPRLPRAYLKTHPRREGVRGGPLHSYVLKQGHRLIAH